MKKISITTEYITLGQFLKFAGIAYSGGDVKNMLENEEILVDGIRENRRGRKLYKNSKISINSELYEIQ